MSIAYSDTEQRGGNSTSEALTSAKLMVELVSESASPSFNLNSLSSLRGSPRSLPEPSSHDSRLSAKKMGESDSPDRPGGEGYRD